MGMFDYVNFKMPCPKCGSEIHGWQTKDSACYLDTVEPDSVNNFYAPCNQCKAWIDLGFIYMTPSLILKGFSIAHFILDSLGYLCQYAVVGSTT